MTQKISKIFLAIFAIIIGLYPAVYFFKERTFGLLSSKSNELLANALWNTAFYTHIILGGIALLIGWLQFNTKLRLRNLSIHMAIGKIYIVSVLISSLASIGLGFFATGGIITSTGFICLGIIWFTTTLLAYVKIRNMHIEQHRRSMIYSYAACFCRGHAKNLVTSFKHNIWRFFSCLLDCRMVVLGTQPVGRKSYCEETWAI